jgi:hypothetical protein
VLERLGEHVLHGVLGLAAVLEQIGASAKDAGAVLLVEVAQLGSRIGRRRLLAGNHLEMRCLAPDHDLL